MPIHDWTRADRGAFHHFHQDWSIELARQLNRGVLPPGYAAVAELKVTGVEPDVNAVRRHAGRPPAGTGLAVIDHPTGAPQVARHESAAAGYARRANRIAVRHRLGYVVAVIEIVSPGNKDSRHAVRSFLDKTTELLDAGVHLLVIDLFPPTPRDPDGLPRLAWDEFTGASLAPRPADKPLTVAAFDACELAVYVHPLAVGDELPDAAVFLEPGVYVRAPLEASYTASWEACPDLVRDEAAPPG